MRIGMNKLVVNTLNVLLLLLLIQPVLCQSSYKDHVQLGDRFLTEGEYLQAASQYAKAYDLKSKKSDLASKAANLFYLSKDYQNASKYFKIVAHKVKKYPLAGLKYARCLKQSGDYEAAMIAYIDYLEKYKLDDRDVIEKIVQQEVKGAGMAKQANEQPVLTGNVIEYIGPGINTTAQELGPQYVDLSTMYYLSNQNGFYRFYKSTYKEGVWQKGSISSVFPTVSNLKLGSGSLSPTGDRYYMTLCDNKAEITQPTAPCQIYVTSLKNGVWTTPKKLPDYINAPNATTAQPFVFKQGDKEILLFASDRIDGFGGMDLYKSERLLSSESTDFSFPQNLGSVVNSVADEVTPFYDVNKSLLYFSSNGFVGFGGYDIYKSKGDFYGWSEPINLKDPVNSSYDDYYYSKGPISSLAVFSSNRKHDKKQARTNNEDLFIAKEGKPKIPVDIQILDSATNKALSEVALAVFVVNNGTKRLIQSELSQDGYFELELPMGATVHLDLQRLDYKNKNKIVEVPSKRREGFQIPTIKLQRLSTTLSDIRKNAITSKPVATIPSQSKVVASNEKVNNTSTVTKSRRNSGVNLSKSVEVRSPATPTRTSKPYTPTYEVADVSYKIQLEARRNLNYNHPRYDNIRYVGDLSSIYIPQKNLSRVLIGEYLDKTEAFENLALVKKAGWRNAYVVRFRSGVYKGRI